MESIGGKIFFGEYDNIDGRLSRVRVSPKVTKSQFDIVDYLIEHGPTTVNKICSAVRISKRQFYDDLYVLTGLCDIYENDKGDTIGILSGWFYDIKRE